MLLNRSDTLVALALPRTPAFARGPRPTRTTPVTHAEEHPGTIADVAVATVPMHAHPRPARDNSRSRIPIGLNESTGAQWSATGA